MNHSAAHCVKIDSKNGILKSVVLGEWNTATYVDCEDANDICSGPVQEISIAEKILHDDKEEDVALLMLSTTVTFNDFVRPICMSRDPQESDESEYVVAGMLKVNIKFDLAIKIFLSTFQAGVREEENLICS